MCAKIRAKLVEDRNATFGIGDYIGKRSQLSARNLLLHRQSRAGDPVSEGIGEGSHQGIIQKSADDSRLTIAIDLTNQRRRSGREYDLRRISGNRGAINFRPYIFHLCFGRGKVACS